MHLIHRGILKKGFKENILGSFKSSFKRGFGIETDIHLTKDNKFVCFHDFTLNRTFNVKKSIKNLNYENLKEISKNKKAEIPLLKDLLKLSKNKHLFIYRNQTTALKKIIKKID